MFGYVWAIIVCCVYVGVGISELMTNLILIVSKIVLKIVLN